RRRPLHLLRKRSGWWEQALRMSWDQTSAKRGGEMKLQEPTPELPISEQRQTELMVLRARVSVRKHLPLLRELLLRGAGLQRVPCSNSEALRAAERPVSG